MGTGTPRNEEHGTFWMYKAANGGSIHAQRKIASYTRLNQWSAGDIHNDDDQDCPCSNCCDDD
jgi:hypothetical protein